MTEAAAPATTPAPPALPEYKFDYTPDSTFEGPEPIVALLIGEHGVGKTHTGMTFPRPMVVFDTESRARAVARKFRDVFIKSPKGWADMKIGINYSVAKMKPGTILIDSGSDIRDMIEGWVLDRASAKGEKAHHKFHWGEVYEELGLMLAFLRSKGWFVVFTARKSDEYVNDIKTGKREASGFVQNKLEFHADFVIHHEKVDGFVRGRVTKNGSKRIGYYNTVMDAEQLNFDGILAEWNAPEIIPVDRLTEKSVRGPVTEVAPKTAAPAPAPASAAPAATPKAAPAPPAPQGAAAAATPAATSAAPTPAAKPPAPPAAPPAPAVTSATPPSGVPAGISADTAFADDERIEDMVTLAAKVGTSADELWKWVDGEGWRVGGKLSLERYYEIMASLSKALAAKSPPWTASKEEQENFSALGHAAGLSKAAKAGFPKYMLGRNLKTWSEVTRDEFERMCAKLIRLAKEKILVDSGVPLVPTPTTTPSATAPSAAGSPPASAIAPAPSPAPSATSSASTPAASTSPTAPVPELAFIDEFTTPEDFGISRTAKGEESFADAPSALFAMRAWAKCLAMGRGEEAKKAFEKIAAAGYLPIPGAALVDDVARIESLFKALGMPVKTGWDKSVERKLCAAPRRLTQAQAKVIAGSLTKALDEMKKRQNEAPK